MLEKKVEKQLIWNCQTDTAEQSEWRYKYTFLIIDSLRDIEVAREKIYLEFEQKDDVIDIADGYLTKENYDYQIFSIRTNTEKREFAKGNYKGLRIKHDKDLIAKDEDEGIKYFERITSRRKQ
jgi:trehalose/maltose hydrolase-like predicted phosphorylase